MAAAAAGFLRSAPVWVPTLGALALAVAVQYVLRNPLVLVRLLGNGLIYLPRFLFSLVSYSAWLLEQPPAGPVFEPFQAPAANECWVPTDPPPAAIWLPAFLVAHLWWARQ